MNLRHRPYQPLDRDACIAVFRTNIPHYFRKHELPQFTEFIDSAECPYFVVLADNGVIGCGGFGVRKEFETADLCWGMVDREQHGRRAGEYLLFARLHAIVRTVEAKYVRLETSQHTDGFFRRYGFEIQSTKVDGIAPGLDTVEMRLELTNTNRQAIERHWRNIAG